MARYTVQCHGVVAVGFDGGLEGGATGIRVVVEGGGFPPARGRGVPVPGLEYGGRFGFGPERVVAVVGGAGAEVVLDEGAEVFDGPPQPGEVGRRRCGR